MSGQANLRIVDEREFARGLRADEEADRRRGALIDHALQAAIAILSAAALWLLTDQGPYTRWAYVVGFASQPFWLWAALRARQWGNFLVAVMYTALWLRGIFNHFL